MRTNFLRQAWTFPIHVFVDCISFTSHDQRSIKASLAAPFQFEIVLLQVMSWWTSPLVVQSGRKYCHHGYWSTHSSTPLTPWRNQPGCNWEKKETKTNQFTGLYYPCFAIWISLLIILILPVQTLGSGMETSSCCHYELRGPQVWHRQYSYNTSLSSERIYNLQKQQKRNSGYLSYITTNINISQSINN